ncbi:MAG: cbb3-type cytochrome c oxidase subunit II [Nitrospinae bacterium]|nr:cbb3-type cytochrome c oxidase subunit II [Nitrospinota bacterium]
MGGMYYVWPRVTGREMWSWRLASWHVWLTIAGATLMFTGLVVQGFIQGTMLESGAEFVDSLVEMKPWWFARTLAGATMDVGFVLMVVNFYQTARHGKPFQEPNPELSRQLEAKPAGETLDWYGRPSAVFIIAGLIFFAAAVMVQGVIPSHTVELNSNKVTDEATGLPILASDYTPLEQRGRHIYIREGCWYCHSQYIRPVAGETMRWGPLSQLGEYDFDQPQMLSTRRIGPDLNRVGRKYGDGWHVAHHWDPRQVVPDSIMPRFPWLFEKGKDGTPVLNDEGKEVVAYIQKLGTNIGDWREGFAPTSLVAGEASMTSQADSAEQLALGSKVYARRCAGCHGAKGDGKGQSAPFLDVKPRDFTSGVFKFHSTPGADALPTDQDLYVTITHGLWGTPMPPWYVLSSQQRVAVVKYVKTFSKAWKGRTAAEPIAVTPEPAVSENSLRHGGQVFTDNCAMCHGDTGRGDGPAADDLTDKWGFHVRPADFTLPAGVVGGVKLGHDGPHIFKTAMNGVGGTPMPVFAETLAPQDVWDVAHFVQSIRIEAHMKELEHRGLAPVDASKARMRLWQNISPAAEQGRIDASVVQGAAPSAKGGNP